MDDPGQIKLLTSADVPAAFELSSLAGWNQTAEDWMCLLRLAPESCYGVEIEDRLAGTATLFCYGSSLAWIGMVLTRPDFRRRGIAKQLLGCMLEYADAHGVRTIKLDATEMGQPLYRGFDFVPEQRVERWVREAGSFTSDAAVFSSPDLSHFAAVDAAAFGLDRDCLLRTLLERSECYTNRDAYLLTRSGRNTSYLGPCVAKDGSSARRVLELALQKPSPGGWCWDILIENHEAVALATQLGFVLQRHLIRMVRGEPLRGEEKFIYAIAGFEFG